MKYGSHRIKRSTSVNYLGVILDQRLSMVEHIRNLKDKANNAVNKLITLAMTSYNLPSKIILLYHNAVLLPIVTYAASVWINKIMKNRSLLTSINSVQRRMLIRLTGAYTTTSLDGLLVCLGLLPLHLQALHSACQYHLRKDDL